MGYICNIISVERNNIDKFIIIVPVWKGVNGMAFEKVKDIIVEQLGVDEDEIKMEASFIDDLDADSLDVVELVMAFEEEFDLKITDEEASKIATVRDAIEYISEQL